MKRFKVNRFLYLLLPVFIVLIAVVYYVILFKHSYIVSNILNLSLDGILLLIYFYKFCLEVRVDNSGVNFYTLFKKYRVDSKNIENIKQSSFLTRIDSERKSFYILTTLNGRDILQEMFKVKTNE